MVLATVRTAGSAGLVACTGAVCTVGTAHTERATDHRMPRPTASRAWPRKTLVRPSRVSRALCRCVAISSSKIHETSVVLGRLTGVFMEIFWVFQAFGSVAMMLESTYSAVYNSFRAVIGVADHFSRMRTQLAQIFSALAVIRTLRWLFRRLMVLLRLREGGLEEDAWAQAASSVAAPGGALSPAGSDSTPRANWPLMLFFAVIIGGPYLIWKFLSSISGRSGEDLFIPCDGSMCFIDWRFRFCWKITTTSGFSAIDNFVILMH